MPGLRDALVGSAGARRVLASPLAVVAAFPWRLAATAKATARAGVAGTKWLFTSRENTNYTYDLTPTNREHLAWFVADLAGVKVTEVRGYLDEIENDGALSEHIAAATKNSPHRWLADTHAKYGRRIGWYALVRALKPKNVVETGTDKGLGTLVIAAALMRNGTGRLTSIDINPAAGYLLSGPYAEVTDLIIADGVATLATLSGVDMFIHDSDHSAAYELREFEAVGPNLSPGAFVLSDNSHASPSLPDWADRTGRRFVFFDERPAGHWYSGAGIGVARS